jgi:GH24 family phage-related lysozyme (muramidase)
MNRELFIQDLLLRLQSLKLSQNQFDALTSFVYNAGRGALAGSTLLKKLNAGDYEGAAKEFAKWDKVNKKSVAGLAKRRAAEADLFNQA